MKSKENSKPTKSSAAQKKKLSAAKKKKPAPKLSPSSKEKKTTTATTPEKKPPVINRMFQKIKKKTETSLKTPDISSAVEIDSIRRETSKKTTPKKPAKKTTKKAAKKVKKGQSDITEGPPPSVLFEKKNIVPLLKLPFIVSGQQTGFTYEMPKEYEPILEETGYQVLQDFGITIVGKWINLGIFGGIYGMCVLTWLRGMREHAERQAIEMAKEKKKSAQEPIPTDEFRAPGASAPPREERKIIPITSTFEAAAAAVKDSV